MSGWTHSLAAIVLRGGTYSVVSQADLALNLTKLRKDGRLRVLTVTNGLTDDAAIIARAAVPHYMPEDPQGASIVMGWWRRLPPDAVFVIQHRAEVESGCD